MMPVAEQAPVLQPREFAQISRLAYEHFGVDLRDGKQALVEARIGKKLRELGLKSFQHYFDYVTHDTSGAALADMVDILTTNHTSFFREPVHFDLLRNTIFPALSNRAEVHLWSAACSTGEEPYSIALTLLEHAPQDTLGRVKIKATDISNRVLEVARRGIYPAERLSSLSQQTLRRYLLKGHNASSASLRFKDEVRAMIAFEHLNLMQELPKNYTCSVIFCRNIMIYFDAPTQQDLVRRLSAHLEPGGYLLIGHSESLNSVTHGLNYVAPATYRKPQGKSR